MKRVMGAVATVTIAAAVQATPAAAQEVLSATCPGPPTSNRNFGPVLGAGNNRFMQTFTVQHTGTLTTVALNVYTMGTPGDFLVQILGVDGGGVPVSSPLSSQTIDDVTVPMDGFIAAHPQPVLNVTAGQQYAVATSRPGSDTSGIRTVQMDPCPGDLFAGGPAPDPLGPEGSDHEMPFSAFVTLPPAPATSAPSAPPGDTPRRKCKKKKKKKRAALSKRCKKKKKK